MYKINIKIQGGRLLGKEEVTSSIHLIYSSVETSYYLLPKYLWSKNSRKISYSVFFVNCRYEKAIIYTRFTYFI